MVFSPPIVKSILNSAALFKKFYHHDSQIRNQTAQSVEPNLILRSRQKPINSPSVDKHTYSFLTFPKRQILDSSELKEFADDNFKVDENGKMFTKGVENTVGKGEIARHEQFLLFLQCFLKVCTADT